LLFTPTCRGESNPSCGANTWSAKKTGCFFSSEGGSEGENRMFSTGEDSHRALKNHSLDTPANKMN